MRGVFDGLLSEHHKQLVVQCVPGWKVYERQEWHGGDQLWQLCPWPPLYEHYRLFGVRQLHGGNVWEYPGDQ
jgi:hypothetical protein